MIGKGPILSLFGAGDWSRTLCILSTYSTTELSPNPKNKYMTHYAKITYKENSWSFNEHCKAVFKTTDYEIRQYVVYNVYK
jgi:hypothetical protein